MSVLIANKVNKNMCLILVQVFIAHTIYVSQCFKLIPRIEQ